MFLGSKEQGYEVYEDLPKGIRGNCWKAGLTIITPERRFIFTCPSEKEQREWLESFRDVLSRPLTPLNLLSKIQGLRFVLLAEGRGQRAKRGFFTRVQLLSPETEVMAPDCAFSVFSPCQGTVQMVHIIVRKPSPSMLSSSFWRPSPIASGGVGPWKDVLRSSSLRC